MTCNRLFIGLMALVLVAGIGVAEESKDAFYYNRLLGRGINLGNALDAPREGDWGMRLEEEYFDLIKQAGFNAVRIPTRWSAHAAKSSPYTIDEAFFKRLDWAVEQALAHGLVAVLNMHHYDEIYQEPGAHRERFLAMWEQIAKRYHDQPDRLYFEILNEPNSKLDAKLWNEYLNDALRIIRDSNPERIVIVGPTQWNAFTHLKALKLPENDRRLIVTFHYYLPFKFTHQGASWAKGSEPWVGTKWTASDEEKQAIRRDFDTAAAWAKEHNRPLYLGEFGVYSRADMESRARWTAFVRDEAEKRGFSWAYWEFGSGFGAYDRQKREWRKPLLEALVPGRTD